MAESISVQCGFCHKGFRIAPSQQNHPVRCPHCKTLVKFAAPTEAAREAIAALSEEIAEQHNRPVTAHRPPVVIRGGVRSKNVAIVWLVLLVVGLIAGIAGLMLVYKPGALGWRLAAESGGSAAAGGARGGPFSPKPGQPSVPGAAPDGGTGPAAMGPVVYAPGMTTPAVDIKVERLIGGYRDETVTYAVGRVTNHAGGMIKVLKVVVPILDTATKQTQIGEATAMLLAIPQGATAPLVAEWVHEAGLRGVKGEPGFEFNPVGVPQDLPVLRAEEPWPLRDPNSLVPSGRIRAKVTNQGVVPVRQVQMYALLLGADGKIVGAARAVVDKQLEPRKPDDVEIRWELCPGHLVQSTEAWAQPAL
jgi:phage FluMu protein Com